MAERIKVIVRVDGGEGIAKTYEGAVAAQWTAFVQRKTRLDETTKQPVQIHANEAEALFAFLKREWLPRLRNESPDITDATVAAIDAQINTLQAQRAARLQQLEEPPTGV